MLATRSLLPSLTAPGRSSARISSARRAAVTVAAGAAPTTVTTLPDGRKVEVYATTADASSAVALSFVKAYKEVCSCC
jgi:hypothetical protein